MQGPSDSQTTAGNKTAALSLVIPGAPTGVGGSEEHLIVQGANLYRLGEKDAGSRGDIKGGAGVERRGPGEV